MRASELDLILVSDPGGLSPDHWMSRWRGKLTTARLIEAPSVGVAPLLEVTASATRPILLVGHSLGAIAIARAGAFLKGTDVRGAFLVAPPADATLPTLPGGPWGLAPKDKLPWKSVLIASQTDPWASMESSRALAGEWGSEFVDAGESGRIDDQSGHGPWPDGLLKLAGFLKGL